MVRIELAVAFEHGSGQRAEGRAGRGLRAALPGGTGTRLLFAASEFKTRQVEGDALVTGRIEHEVKGQTVGLVEMEGSCAGQHGNVILRLPAYPIDGGIQLFRSQGQGSSETLFFGTNYLGDAAGTLDQLRVGTLHFIPNRVDHAEHERIFLAQHAAMTDAPAQDLT